MGLFNTIFAPLACPRCRARVETEVHVQVGYVADKLRLHVGDVYPGLATAGAATLRGDLDAEGWCVCPSCDSDFFCRVEIRQRRVTGVAPDLGRFPLGPDATWDTRLFCPRHACMRNVEARLFAGHTSGARHVQAGDSYLADDFPGLDATLRGLGICGNERDSQHAIDLSVRVVAGRLADIEVSTADSPAPIFLP
jgi:hypothetical protein